MKLLFCFLFVGLCVAVETNTTNIGVHVEMSHTSSYPDIADTRHHDYHKHIAYTSLYLGERNNADNFTIVFVIDDNIDRVETTIVVTRYKYILAIAGVFIVVVIIIPALYCCFS